LSLPDDDAVEVIKNVGVLISEEAQFDRDTMIVGKRECSKKDNEARMNAKAD